MYQLLQINLNKKSQRHVHCCCRVVKVDRISKFTIAQIYVLRKQKIQIENLGMKMGT